MPQKRTPRSACQQQPEIFEDAFKPSLEVLTALGSLAVHIEEFFDLIPGGAASLYEAARFDVAAMRTLLNSPHVQEWRRQMDKLALLPKRRTCNNSE